MPKSDHSSQKRSLVPLFFLVLIFAMPPLVGWVFFLNPQWLPGSTVNNGTLIEPARAVDKLLLTTAADQPLDWGQFRDKWILTVIQQGVCDAACIERLIEVRQLRRALAADRKRVSRLLIQLPDSSGDTPAPPDLTGLQGTLSVSASAEAAAQLRTVFQLDQVDPGKHIFLIDPRATLMMRHNIEALEPKAVLKDLEMLLKASANWVTGE